MVSKCLSLTFNGAKKQVVLKEDWSPEYMVGFIASTFGAPESFFSPFLPVVDPKGNFHSLSGSLEELDPSIPYQLVVDQAHQTNPEQRGINGKEEAVNRPNQPKKIPAANKSPLPQGPGPEYLPSVVLYSPGEAGTKNSRNLKTPPTFSKKGGNLYNDFVKKEKLISDFNGRESGFLEEKWIMIESDRDFESKFAASSFQIGCLVACQKETLQNIFSPEVFSVIKIHSHQVGLYFLPKEKLQSNTQHQPDYNYSKGANPFGSLETENSQSKQRSQNKNDPDYQKILLSNQVSSRNLQFTSSSFFTGFNSQQKPETLVKIHAKNGRTVMITGKETPKKFEKILKGLLEDNFPLSSLSKFSQKLLGLLDSPQVQTKLTPASVWLLRLKIHQRSNDLFKTMIEQFFRNDQDDHLCNSLVQFMNEELSSLSSPRYESNKSIQASYCPGNISNSNSARSPE